MIAGIDRLRRAADVLRRGGSSDRIRERVVAAATEYWSAAFDAPDWPAELRRKSEELHKNLFLYGPIRQSVEQMSERELRRLDRDLRAFLEFAESLNDGLSASESRFCYVPPRRRRSGDIKDRPI